MWAKDCVSAMVVSSTMTPQGTVLAPIHILYTSDFTYSSSNFHLQKFSDNFITCLIANEEDTVYRGLMKDRCLQNHLQINMDKTRTAGGFQEIMSISEYPVNGH